MSKLNEVAAELVALSDEDFEKISIAIMTEYLLDCNSLVISVKDAERILTLMSYYEGLGEPGYPSLSDDEEEVRTKLSRAIIAIAKVKEAAGT